MDWTTVAVGAATAALSTLAVMRLDRSRNAEIRTGQMELKAATFEVQLERACIDIRELEERVSASELEVAALKERTNQHGH
jgi:hypothetical protein